MKRPYAQLAVWAPLRHAAESTELGKELDTQEQHRCAMTSVLQELQRNQASGKSPQRALNVERSGVQRSISVPAAGLLAERQRGPRDLRRRCASPLRASTLRSRETDSTRTGRHQH